MQKYWILGQMHWIAHTVLVYKGPYIVEKCTFHIFGLIGSNNLTFDGLCPFLTIIQHNFWEFYEKILESSVQVHFKMPLKWPKMAQIANFSALKIALALIFSIFFHKILKIYVEIWSGMDIDHQKLDYWPLSSQKCEKCIFSLYKAPYKPKQCVLFNAFGLKFNIFAYSVLFS